MSGDQAGWQKPDYNKTPPPQYTFAVKLPAGEYEIALMASNPVPARTYGVYANGVKLFWEEVTIDNYIDKYLNRHRNVEYELGQDMFNSHIDLEHPVRQYKVKVTNGLLELKIQHIGLEMLVIYPVSEIKSGREFLDELHEARRKEFYAKAYTEVVPEEGKADFTINKEDKERGFLLFSRDYTQEIYPKTIPGKEEIGLKVQMKAAKGETEPAVVGIYPLKALKGVQVSVTDLKRKDGKVLSSKNIDIYKLRYYQKQSGPASIVHKVVPLILEKFSSMNIPDGQTTGIWLNAKVPKETMGGVYTGQLEVKTADGKKSAIEIELAVRTFALPDPEDMKEMFMWFYKTPAWKHEGYKLFWFKKKGEKLTKKILEADFRSMKQHGCNSIHLPDVKINSVDDSGNVTIDYSELEMMVEAMKRVNIGLKHPNMLFTLPAANQLKQNYKLEEFSDKFNQAFKNYIQQLENWFEKENIQAIFWVTDQPQEKTPGKLDLKQAEKYLKLVSEVKGAKSSVSLQFDSNGGVDYVPFAGKMDFAQVFPMEESKGLRKKASAENNLLIFNSGKNINRFVFGFYPWAIGALGRTQWNYHYLELPFYPLEGMGDHIWSISAVTFPSAQGPVSTTYYEWSREGIDDWRYITLLETLIKENKNTALVKEAEILLEEIKAQVPGSLPEEILMGNDGLAYKGLFLENTSKWREKIADNIERLIEIK